MVRPQGFQWRKHPKHPGVEVKNLGSFHEYGTAISIWRLAPGTVIAPEVIDAPEVRCVIAGETHYEGRLLDDKSTYYIPEGVRTSPIESPKGAELLVFSLPMYAKAAWDKAHGRDTVAAYRSVGLGLYIQQQGGEPAGSPPCLHQTPHLDWRSWTRRTPTTTPPNI